MEFGKSLWSVAGPVLGVALLVFVIAIGVNRLQETTGGSGTVIRIDAEPITAGAAEAEGAPAVSASPGAQTDQPAASESAAVPVAAQPQAAAPSDVTGAFAKAGCAGCHIIPGIPGANGTVGPDLSSIGVDAASRVAGQDADAYLRQSILEPNAFIAPDCNGNPCPPGVMLQTFASALNQDELDTIVAYLAVLGTDQMPALAAPDDRPAVSLDTGLPAESVLEPFLTLPKDPASEAQIALGKYLFFDERLSGNVSRSCASCHQPDKGFTDGLAVSDGYPSTKLFRNTPSLYNTAYADYLYWDGRMDGGDLPTTVRDHLTEAHFMSMDGRLMFERLKQVPAYVELFEEAFGGEPSFGRVLNAITAYVNTLNSSPGPYDAALAGDASAFSPDELVGFGLFTGKAGCSDCHSGPTLTDEGFYNLGLTTDPAMLDDPERAVTWRRFFRIHGTPNFRNLRSDPGLYALTKQEEDRGKFNTPSLREVGRTAPYMHDGRFATLEEVVRFYNNGGGEGQTAGLEPLGLSEQEIGQLVAFLNSLSSEPAAVTVPDLPDYELLTLGDEGVQAADLAPAASESAAPAEETTTPAAIDLTDIDLTAVEDIVNKGACAGCHVIPDISGAVGVVGPDLTNIGVEAAERQPGTNAEEYIYQSLVDPNAFVAPDCPIGPCPANVMPANLTDTLSPEEIDLLVAYLLSLGNGR